MKRFLGLLVIAGMFTFVACGPSADEIEAIRIQDSTRVADSLMQEQIKADSIAKAEAEAAAIVEAEKMKQDSIAEAEKAKGGKKKK